MSIPIKSLTIDFLEEDVEGPTRRLMAATAAAVKSGHVGLGLGQISRDFPRDRFSSEHVTSVTYAVTISSDGRVSSDVAYYIAGRVTIGVDARGFASVTCRNASCVVLDDEHSEGTYFSGEGVNYALTNLFRKVAFRDLALAHMGLVPPPRETKSLKEWERTLGQDLVLSDEVATA